MHQELEPGTTTESEPVLSSAGSVSRTTAFCLAGAVLVWAVLATWCVVRLDGRSIDDYFITYRYAQNLVNGNGFVFNPGERVFGTTAPGMGLLLALLHLLTRLPVHLLGTVTTGLSLVLLAVLLLRECRRCQRTMEGIVAGSWLVACTFLWLYHGSETPVALTMVALAALVVERRPLTAGLLAGLAVWFRPETGLAAAWLGLLAWRERRALPWRYGLAVAGVVVLGLAAAWWWFGQPLPATLGAKQAQGDWQQHWVSGLAFWRAAASYLKAQYAGSMTLAMLIAGLTGMLLALQVPSRPLRVLVLLSLSLLPAYPLLGVSFAPWYTVPLVVTLVYGCTFLAFGVARMAARRWVGPGRQAVVAGAAGIVLLLPLAVDIAPTSLSHLRHFSIYSWRHKLYQRAGLWIKEHAQPHDEIGYVEVGTIAYWSEQPIRDMLGLVTPASIPYVRRGDLVGAFLVKPPYFVLRHSRVAMMDVILAQPWFADCYLKVGSTAIANGGEELTLYSRRPDAAPPPPPELTSGS